MFSGRRVFALVTSIAAVVTPVLIGSPAANAATAIEDQYCWASEATGYSACFDTEAEMDADVYLRTGANLIYLSEDPYENPEGDAVAGRSAPGSADAAAAAYVLATIYDDQNYGGGSYTFTDTHSSTCADYSYTFNTMPSGWDNRVSSFKSYGSCKTRISENVNQGGRSVGPVATKSYVGDTLNDKASSMLITG